MRKDKAMKTNQTKAWGSTTLAVLLTLLCLPGQQNLRAQPESHHFTSIAKLSDNTIALALDGRVAPSFNSYFDLYVLETATNLNDWTPLVTLLRNNRVPDEVGWIDTNVSLIEKRFYRTFTNHLITAFPKPTGPFAVGTFSRVIADPARTNRYRYNNQTNSFMFTCWYPAEAQAGLLPGAAYDTQVAQDASRYGDFGENSSWASIVPHLKGHSLPNAPIARGTNRYPIILYSHGFRCHRKSNCHEAEELASHGYVVVGVDHEDCWGTEFPDGRYLKASYPWPLPTASVSYLIDSRVKDLICAMDELGRLDAIDPWLAGRLDLNCLGTLGMSFGGSSTANLCRSNATVKCAAFLDAAFHLDVNVELNQEGLPKPFLAMNNNNLAYPYFFFWPESTNLFNLATTNAVIFQIQNSSHFSFFDFAWFIVSKWPQSRVMDACMVSFFNKHLKAQDDHLLDQSPPKYPDENFQVINFMKK
jgi:hypothetical protein